MFRNTGNPPENLVSHYQTGRVNNFHHKKLSWLHRDTIWKKKTPSKKNLKVLCHKIWWSILSLIATENKKKWSFIYTFLKHLNVADIAILLPLFLIRCSIWFLSRYSMVLFPTWCPSKMHINFDSSIGNGNIHRLY